VKGLIYGPFSLATSRKKVKSLLLGLLFGLSIGLLLGVRSRGHARDPTGKHYYFEIMLSGRHCGNELWAMPLSASGNPWQLARK